MNAHGEAMKYIPRISDPEEQVAMLLKVGYDGFCIVALDAFVF